MTSPLNYTEKQELQARITKLTKTIVVLKEAKQNILTIEIPNTQKKEDTNKKMWDYYHNIISSYEAEKQALNGSVLTDPVTEVDITNRVDLTGRLYALSEPEIVRIPQFGGTPVTTNLQFSEQNDLTLYTPVWNRLKFGLTTSTAFGFTTDSPITPSSTNFSTTLDPSVLLNKEFVVSDGITSFIGFATAITPAIFPLLGFQVDFNFLTTITNTININATGSGIFTGFTNTERANKQSTSPAFGALQTIMDFYVAKLVTIAGNHEVNISTQISSVTNNQDPDLAPILTQLNDNKATITAYKTSTPIDDTGITDYTSFIDNTRTPYITTRINTISTQVTIFYDNRYDWGKERAGSKGTLIALKALNASPPHIDSQVLKAENSMILYKSVP